MRILDSTYDTHGLNMEASLSLTIPLLAELELRVLPIPVSNTQLCDRLIQRFPPAPTSFHILPALVRLSQLDGDLKAYLDEFLVLKAKLPDLSSHEARSIFWRGLSPSVRAHVLGVPNVSTFERALEEARNLVIEQHPPAPEPAP